jgi:hypothetical protein
MAFPRILPDRPLTAMERWRRWKMKKMGLTPEPAPARVEYPPGLADQMGLLTWDEHMERIAAAKAAKPDGAA